MYFGLTSPELDEYSIPVELSELNNFQPDFQFLHVTLLYFKEVHGLYMDLLAEVLWSLDLGDPFYLPIYRVATFDQKAVVGLFEGEAHVSRLMSIRDQLLEAMHEARTQLIQRSPDGCTGPDVYPMHDQTYPFNPPITFGRNLGEAPIELSGILKSLPFSQIFVRFKGKGMTLIRDFR